MKLVVGKTYTNYLKDKIAVIGKFDGFYVGAMKMINGNIAIGLYSEDGTSKECANLLEEYVEPASCERWASIRKETNVIINIYETEPNPHQDYRIAKVLVQEIE